jgi:hypothetical protein
MCGLGQTKTALGAVSCLYQDATGDVKCAERVSRYSRGRKPVRPQAKFLDDIGR